MGLQNELCLFIFLTTVTGVLGGEYCSYYDDGIYRPWCPYGCCVSDCCDYSTTKVTNVALIVGLSVLGVIVVSTVIAVVCCCVRRRAAYGQVIRTNAGPTVMMATAQTTVSPGQPMYPTSGYQPGVHAPPQSYPMGQQYPHTAQPYGAPAPQPYGAPAPQPAAAAMAPPPYAHATGGQDNPGFDNKQMNY